MVFRRGVTPTYGVRHCDRCWREYVAVAENQRYCSARCKSLMRLRDDRRKYANTAPRARGHGGYRWSPRAWFVVRVAAPVGVRSWWTASFWAASSSRRSGGTWGIRTVRAREALSTFAVTSERRRGCVRGEGWDGDDEAREDGGVRVG